MLGLHALDWAILIVYISIVAYLGLFLGARKTRFLHCRGNLGQTAVLPIQLQFGIGRGRSRSGQRRRLP